MTSKKREKLCLECGCSFIERYSDSNKQWDAREYCSMKCNNGSKSRFTDIYERIIKFQVVNDKGCWSWSGSKDGKGYGTISNRKGSKFSPEKAHRVSYEKHFGLIPAGMLVCHKCDNPECTNPEHLFIGTQKDNMQDCSNKNRISKVGIQNLKHEKSLTKEEVDVIKEIIFVGKNGRGNGRTKKSVAQEYGVCVDLIYDICKGIYYGK